MIDCVNVTNEKHNKDKTVIGYRRAVQILTADGSVTKPCSNDIVNLMVTTWMVENRWKADRHWWTSAT